MDIAVTHLSGDRFAVQVRDHRLVVDQRVADGGQDAGPTPTELFAASLAACVGFYAGRFLRRHGLEAGGLRVDCHATMSADRPARVAAITLRIGGLPQLPSKRRDALLAVVEHCTVHNSIRAAPTIEIGLAAAAPAGVEA
jgi:putative redox protein